MRRTLLILIFSILVFLAGCLSQQTDKKFCKADSDCICMGIDNETGSCYIGNKDYYEKSVLNKTYICPDFCTGIAGNFEIKCKENKCSQVKKY